MSKPEFEVQKIAAYMPVSAEQAMELGLIPDTRTPMVIPWRRHVRWAIGESRQRLGVRLGSWIAGRNLDPDQYDD